MRGTVSELLLMVCADVLSEYLGALTQVAADLHVAVVS